MNEQGEIKLGKQDNKKKLFNKEIKKAYQKLPKQKKPKSLLDN